VYKAGGACYANAMTTVYRILSQEAWLRALATGVFHGAPLDLRDGFIHFSSADQVASTLQAHYPQQDGLVLLYVRLDAVSPNTAWRWEPARGGALFPHLYAPLPVAAVHRVEPLSLDSDGKHHMPMLES
jgi:uncharacterized protein (DUF952 family)